MDYRIKKVLEKIDEETNRIKNGFKKGDVPYQNMTKDFDDDWVLLYVSDSRKKDFNIWCASKLEIEKDEYGHGEYNPYNVSSCTYAYGGGIDGMDFEINNNWLYRYRENAEESSDLIITNLILDTFDLHYIDDKKAHCRWSEKEEWEEKIIYHEEDNFKCLIMDKYLLEVYLYFRKTKLEYCIDCLIPKSLFPKEEQSGENYFDTELILERGLKRENIYSEEKLEEFVRGKKKENKEYLDFIVFDWRNGREIEINIKEDNFTNYFIAEENKPFETSIVFFNSKVLDKYRSDERYDFKLNSHLVSKKLGWMLHLYDNNEYDQVNILVCDLQDLPINEQYHWKSHNEKKKGEASKNLIKRAFVGSWDNSGNPITEFEKTMTELYKKEIFDELPENKKNLKNSLVISNEHGNEQWSSFVIALNQMTIESINKNYLSELGIKGKGYKGIEELFKLRSLNFKAFQLLYELRCDEGHREKKHETPSNTKEYSKKLIGQINKELEKLL